MKLTPREGDLWVDTTRESSIDRMTILFVDESLSAPGWWNVYVTYQVKLIGHVAHPMFTSIGPEQVNELYNDPEGSGLTLTSRNETA